ncbi:MAG: hypothetical protein U0133_19345 [Gemmatimonadales bacterium]
MARPLLLALVLVTSSLSAQAKARASAGGFRLFDRVQNQPGYVLTRTNRVDCGITPFSYGGIGGDIYFDCYWPLGTPNGYVFGGGLRVAGIIGPELAAWAGDTAGAFFFDSKGTTEHGTLVQGLWYSSVPADASRWPEIARVPTIGGEVYRPELRGRNSVSDGDIWYLITETDVNQLAGRAHPLGLAVETRYLQFNRPRGNEDILYAVNTVYNISATNPAAYSGVRPELRPTLLALAERYHRDVLTKFAVTLPADGYTIQRYFTDIITDADVGSAGGNVASVDLPLSVGFTWDPRFAATLPGWRYDPTDHGPPFFAGSGFYGTKVLQAPAGGNAIQLFTSYIGSGFGNDAANVVALYRHLDGSPAPDLLSCNQGDPLVTHICLVWPSGLDVRQSVSSAGGDLAPGQSATYAVAYLFAAPYGGCGPAACNVSPGNPRRLTDPVLFAAGVNPIDSITGYTGFNDYDGDGLAAGGEVRAAPRSLLGKAQLAQALFDEGFLVPSAPVAPEFYLIPGNNQVTILWRPSLTESTGDPYYDLTTSPTRTTPGGALAVNPLYDPNFRRFDVEGYRVYRGRTTNPSELVQVAQFDYAGTTMLDYTGRVNEGSGCAPELGLRTQCGPVFDSLVPGQPLVAHRVMAIGPRMIQVRDGDRIRLPGNVTATLRADTVGSFDQATCLCDTGVPFLFVDHDVRNSADYFYAVTAFDVNSAQSGPASMESVRLVKRVRPTAPAVNLAASTRVSVTLEGRGKLLDTALAAPTWDPTSGRLSGPFPPANNWAGVLSNLASELVAGEHVARIRLDSLSLGQPEGSFFPALPGIPVQLYLTIDAGGVISHATAAIPQNVRESDGTVTVSTRAAVMETDPGASGRYGAPSLPVFLDLKLGLANVAYSGDAGSGFNAETDTANGSRWFDGPSPQRNEVVAQPTAGNCLALFCTPPATFSNAGRLTGVTTVYQPHSYVTLNRSWRNMGMTLAGAHRGADYNVYWGNQGEIDSVIDVTHNVPVPFSAEAGGTWGILNTSAQGPGGFDNRPTVLTPYDWSCVEPFRSRLTLPQAIWFPCTSAAAFTLSRQAELGTIAFAYGDTLATQAVGARNPANLSPEPGFALYIAGTISQFGLTTLPAKGTVWTLRDYVGVMKRSGLQTTFQLPFGGQRPWTAVGTELVVRVSAENGTRLAASRDLRRVHTVPDPYYLTSDLVEGTGIRFVHLPASAIVRIYSAAGTLLRVLEHDDPALTDNLFWDLRTRNGQRVASGVYFYHIEAGDARRIGRMTVVNYAN